jgi:hypothetical protein
MISQGECNKYFCDNNLHTESNYRKHILGVKKQIQGEGIVAFEHDPRYKKVTQCRTNIDEIPNEEKCRNLNRKPSYYTSNNTHNFKDMYGYDPRYPYDIRNDISIMNEVNKIFSYPYMGPRSRSDLKNVHIFPRWTVNEFMMKLLWTKPDKFDIIDRCTKILNKKYDKDVVNTAKREANAAKQATKDAEKAAKQAAKDAEKAAKQAAKDAEKAAKQAERESKKTQKTKPKQNKTQKTPPKEPSPLRRTASPSPNNEQRKRCPNGTRRNKKTGDCEKY